MRTRSVPIKVMNGTRSVKTVMIIRLYYKMPMRLGEFVMGHLMQSLDVFDLMERIKWE